MIKLTYFFSLLIYYLSSWQVGETGKVDLIDEERSLERINNYTKLNTMCCINKLEGRFCRHKQGK
mgnify:CR=1 FL=1